MATPNIVYKTLILYLLDCSSCPLSNLQISDFFLQEEYTDYFKVQEILAELVTSELVEEIKTHENTLYTLSSKGKETLGFSQDKINYTIKEDVKKFFKKNQLTIRYENSIYSDYRRLGPDLYQAELHIREEQTDRLAIAMTVHTKEQAEAICRNWKTSCDDVYATLMDKLLR